MKIISCITSLYIGFFITAISLPTICQSVKLIETEFCRSKSCMASPVKKEIPQTGCAGCISFLNITSFGYYQSPQYISFKQWADEIKKTETTELNFSSTYISDCWQPPELKKQS